MSKRYNNGSHYENHQRADELHDAAAHAHRVGEQHGQQEHLTGHEHSRHELEYSAAETNGKIQPSTTGHGVASFGHDEIAALAHEYWRARGCPTGSADENWFQAVKELRSRALGH
jgi:hypothetical protein